MNEEKIGFGDTTYMVTFSPTDNQVSEIEKWLIAEMTETGEGFYWKWENLKYAAEKKQMAVISLNNNTLGFATWHAVSEKTTQIQYAEVRPGYRQEGVGNALVTELLRFLRADGHLAIDLQCAPEESEPIWKRLSFVEFPDPPTNYNFSLGDNKRLYIILSDFLKTSTELGLQETLELWNDEPYTTFRGTPPTYIWNLDFIEGARILSKPIIHPGHYEWRSRWNIKGKTRKDGKVKYFGTKIDFGKFIIIHELPI